MYSILKYKFSYSLFKKKKSVGLWHNADYHKSELPFVPSFLNIFFIK